jgi:hypothetical protein
VVVTLERNVILARHKIINIHLTIWEIQGKTGHFGAMGQNVSRPPNPQEYGDLSVELSSVSQSISLSRRIAKSTVRLCDFLLESMTCLEELEDSSMRNSISRAGPFHRDSQILKDLTRAAANKSGHHLDLFDHYKELCLVQNQTVGASFPFPVSSDTDRDARYIISLPSVMSNRISKLPRIQRASPQQASGTAPRKFCPHLLPGKCTVD